MQLAGTTGLYLGYCEGVVGHFKGEHVRFHGKLKRPVMTKRVSASPSLAGGQPSMSATSSPVPSVSPSPRVTPALLAGTSSASAIADSPRWRSSTRESEVLSNPFDLELDDSPSIHTRDLDADENENETDGGSKQKRRTRAADDLPGLEMFLPRSRSGSRSRPSSRAFTDDEKGSRLLLKSSRIATPPQLPFSASPRTTSLDTPSSPLPPPSPLFKSHTSPPSPKSAKGVLQVHVDVDVVVQVSPRDEAVQPTSVPSADIPKLDLQEAEPEPELELEPVNSKHEEERTESPTSMPEVSSLYQASLRSSVYSTQSYRSSMQIPGGFGRLSRSDLDDGDMGGIGLSMLQGMADDEDEDEVDFSAVEVPPTPRPPIRADESDNQKDKESITETETKSEDTTTKEDDKDDDEDDNVEDDDEEYIDDDDASYWDGADIYDSYRYSRYSVMTKGSRRKSRFSMISRVDYGDGELDPPPPIPAEGFPRSDSAMSKRSFQSLGEDRKKHIPPPLSLVKTSVPPVLLSPSGPLPVDSSSVGNSSMSDKRSTVEYASTSPQPSPLLHTNFPSPRTSSSRATSFGAEAIDETPAASPAPSMLSFNVIDKASGNGLANISGAASALRQRLENENASSSGPFSGSGPGSAVAAVGLGIDATHKKEKDTMSSGIVVDDDDDDVSVLVVPADDDINPGNSSVNASDVRDSVQSSVSDRSVASFATDVSEISNVSDVIRKMEADLKLSSSVLGTNNTSESSTHSNNQPTTKPPTSTTQPLRIQGRISPLPPQEGSQPVPASINPGQTPPGPSASHLRPQLRPEQALFLPHPNAPPPNPLVLSGQRVSTYGMPPVHDPPQTLSSPSNLPNGNTLLSTLRSAAANRFGPAGVPHNPTIYGKPIADLATSDGPVLMMWSISPFPPEPVSRTNSPAPNSRVPRRAATTGASPLSQSVSVPASPLPPPTNERLNNGAPALRAPVPTIARQDGDKPTGSNVLLRPNFSPQVHTVRPRSRSFSGFARDAPVPADLKNRTSEDQNRPTRTASLQSLKEAANPKGAAPIAIHQPRQTSVSSIASARGIHSPSPLSLPQNNTVMGTPRSFSLSKSSSPLGRAPITSLDEGKGRSASLDIENSSRKTKSSTSLDKLEDVLEASSSIKSTGSESPLASPSTSIFQSLRRNSGDNASTNSTPTSTPSAMQRLRRLSSPSKAHQRTVSQQSRNSSSSDPRSAITSPPGNSAQLAGGDGSPAQRSNSVKSKISLSHLRIRSSSTKEQLDGQTPSPSTGPATPIPDFDNQPETVHVQDAEFEMIRPTIRRISSEPMSDESGPVREGREERPSLQQEQRNDSPNPGSLRSVLSPVQGSIAESQDPPTRHGKPLEMTSSMEAHRNRENKWISAMSAVPAPQARKSKKIRRLVLEGVPSSVRYLVWSHLTDSKAKHIPGVYGKLGRRGRIAATDAIERDAVRCFPDQRHLQDPKGPLVGLLQTYLTMVPDLEYQTSKWER